MTTDKMSRRTVLWSFFLIFLLSAALVTTLMTSISASPPTHDIAVTKIALSYNTTVVFPTWERPLNITVTVKNNGNSKETFNLTAYYNETQWNPIQTKTVEDLAWLHANERNETFTWDCRNLPGYSDDPDLASLYPVYEIKANATLAGDANPSDNELINGDVTVQWPGDCDGDGYVNDADYEILNASWLSQFPDPNYNASADFNGDGMVNGWDLDLMSYWWHKGPAEAHDVAVVNITFLYNTNVVFPTWGSSLNINVMVENMGWEYSENFTVTACYKLYNETEWNLIETPQNVTNLTPGAKETLTFLWDLPTWDKYPDNRKEAWPYPVHDVKANASTVEKETKINDNDYSRNVTVQWPGDCDGDGYVNDADYEILNASLPSQFPDPNYNASADFNGDGMVSGWDLGLMSDWWHKGPRDYIDVAVTNITLSYDTWVVYTNCSLIIYVTVKNNGTQTETFDVTAYYNTTAVNTTVIDTKQVTMTAGDKKNVTFTWIIPNAIWPYRNYTLNAKVTLSPDENPANNQRTDGTLTVRWPGDCNGDGYVNATDLLRPYFRDDLDVYNTRSDFNGDCLVDTEDLKILIDHWETGPPY